MVKYAIPGPQGEKATTAARVARIAKKSAKKHVKKGAKNAIHDVIYNNGNAEQPILPEVYFYGDADFTSNKALNGSGGAIALQDHGMALFEGKATFTGNAAGKNGGALGMDGSNTIFVAVEGADCSGNSAGGDGGAFYIDEQSAVTLGEKSTFSGNSAGGKNGGGAIYAEGETGIDEDEAQTTLETGDITFTNNKATYAKAHGGACLLDVISAHFCGYAVFQNNTAGKYGGAIYFRTNYSSTKNSDDTVTNCSELYFYDNVLFSGNTSGDNGGALYVCTQSGSMQKRASDTGKVIFYKDVIFTGNKSNNSGNAMYLDDNSCVRFSGNMTLEKDQAIYVDKNAVLEWDIVRDGDNTACISDYSQVFYHKNGKRYILLNDRETAGKTSYILAENAASAKGQVFCIWRKNEEAFTITVGSYSIGYLDYTYQLAVDSANQLVLNVVGGVTKTSATNVSSGENFFTDGWFEGYSNGAFSVASGGMLDLYDATFKNCSTPGNGGAILNYGTVYLDNVTFSGNTAKGGTAWGNGGAILNWNGGTIELVGDVTLATDTDYITNYGNLDWVINRVKHGYLSDFSKINNGTGYSYSVTLDPSECLLGNYKLASNAANAQGKSFTINVFDTDTDEAEVTQAATITVNGNAAELDGRYVLLYTDENNDLWCSVKDQYICSRTVVSSELTLTETHRFDGWTYNGDGSVFYVNSTGTLSNTAAVIFKNCSATRNGGVIYNSGGTIALSNAIFTDNYAGVEGGAICSIGKLTLSDVTFSGNSADNGGAICAASDSSVTLTDVTFSGNSSNQNGGAISLNNNAVLNLDNVTFNGNTAAALGGAINSCGSKINLQGSVSLETAADTINLDDSSNMTWVIHYAKTGCVSDYSLITGTKNTNTLTVDAGEAKDSATYILAYNAETANGQQFSIILKDATQTTITVNGDMIIDSNNANYKMETDAAGRLVLSVEDHTVIDSAYTISKEQQFEGHTYKGSGAAFYVTPTGWLNNTANVSFRNYYAKEKGGVIYSEGKVTFSDVTFNDNKANDGGGAIYADSGSSVTLADATFIGNSADKGGAIYADSYSSVTLTDATFRDNSADAIYTFSENGGAIYLDSHSSVTLNNATFLGNNADDDGGAIYADSESSVMLTNATFIGNSADKGGTIYAASYVSITLNDAIFSSNSAEKSGGAIYLDSRSSITLSNATFSGNSADNGGAIYLDSHSSVTLSNATFSGNSASKKGGAIYIDDGATLNIAGRITLATSDDIIYNNGTLNWDLTKADSENNDFSVALSRIKGNGERTITISDNGLEHNTDYILAEETPSPVLCMTTASPMLTIADDEEEDEEGEGICYYTIKNESGEIIGLITENNVLIRGNDIYRLENVDGKVTFSVVESVTNLTGDAEEITWEGNAKEFTTQVSTDNFETSCTVITTSHGVNYYGLPEDNYQARVKNTLTKDWTETLEITSEYEPVQPSAWISEENGETDLFFANPSGTWTSGYIARNKGQLGGWTGTRETASILRKNRLADTFTGSDDASILVLTDDDNGDVLFVDDIYTEFPAEHQARIAQIDQIRAGAGDDVIDLTSQRYEYIGDGVLVRGGFGDDTIWANNGENKLFGDAGNDRLVGASGNDVLSGGIGDDSLHGGGGDDIFCFCNDWGSDTVEQLADGKVTLWFMSGSEDNWNQDSLTYTDGENSVKVSGVSEVTLKFGIDETQECVALAASGCFLEESSEKIFETPEIGMLA